MRPIAHTLYIYYYVLSIASVKGCISLYLYCKVTGIYVTKTKANRKYKMKSLYGHLVYLFIAWLTSLFNHTSNRKYIYAVMTFLDAFKIITIVTLNYSLANRTCQATKLTTSIYIIFCLVSYTIKKCT